MAKHLVILLNMTHDEFLEKYLRTAYREPGMSTYECVAFAKLYSKEVLGIPLGTFGGTARSGWLNKSKTFDPKKWTRVKNTPDAISQQGAIIFYDKPGLTGHVGVVHDATVNDVTLIEQNGSTGNGDGKGYNAINFEVKRDYDACLGWMIKK